MLLKDYPFKMKPLAHQAECLARFADWPACGFLMDMGCGKTKTLLDNAGYLYLDGKIQALLVVAPKGVYLNWVHDEIPKHVPLEVKYEMAYWSSAPKKFERDSLTQLMESKSSSLKILAMNIEAIGGKKGLAYVKAFLKKYRSLMVIDESTTIKNIDAIRTDVCINVGKTAKYRRILTGNVMPNGPLDIFSQAEFLAPGLLGHRSYYGYRNSVAVFQDTYNNAGKVFKAIVGYRDVDKITDNLHKFAFIVKKEDCLDLPQKIFMSRNVEMGPKQAKAYEDMRDKAIVELSEGTVTAVMVLTQLTRLHQIACGFTKLDQTNVEVGFDEPNARLSELLDVLDGIRRKAIVWCNYRHNLDQVYRAIVEKYGKDSVVRFDGSVKQDDRTYAKNSFQDADSPVRFFVANPAAGKFGITLTQADTCVYYSNSYNLEDRLQSEDRAHRIGQDVSVVYLDLRVRGTVDDKIISALRDKKMLSDSVLISNWRTLLTP